MHHTIKTALLAWASCLGLSLAPQGAVAQDFPARPVTMTVGYGAGDNMDLMARVLATRVEKILGQPFVVMNKPGAAGAVALGSLAKEKPDGYQLGVVIDTPLDRLPLLRKLPYKMDDFVPVLQFASGATGVVVKSSAPWKTLPEFIQYAKENPGKVTYTTTGVGSTMHVAFQYIEKQAGIEWIHVPYPGAKQGLTAVMGGHVTAAVGSTQWAPEVNDGSLRLLATIGEQRMKAFPGAPTIRELGYNFGAASASLIVAPKGTPPAVVKKLGDAFRQAMDDPEYVRLMNNIHLEAVHRNSDEAKKYLEDIARDFAKVIVELKIPTEFDSK